MRLAVTNECFTREFRDQANVKVQSIEDSIDAKIKALTDTTHYDEFQANIVPVEIRGVCMKYNNSWRFNNLVCLDFVLNTTPIYQMWKDDCYLISNPRMLDRMRDMGILRCFTHDLSISGEPLVTYAYSPQLNMFHPGIYAIFHSNGIVEFQPQYAISCVHTMASGGAGTCSDALGWVNELAVNCLVILN